MASRLQSLGRVLRLTRASDQLQHVRRQSIFSEFQKKLKEEIESNPSIKQSVEELKQTKESLKERTKAATETISKAASASAGATRATTQEVSSRVQESFSRVSQGVKSTTEELSKTAAKTGSQAESAAEQAAASSQAQEAGTDTQKDPAEASGASAGTSGTSQGPAGSTDEDKAGPGPEQEQESDQAQGPGAGARAAGALSIMERLRSMASMVQREVAAAVLPESTTSSATRAYDDSLRSDHVNASTGITVAPETRWQKQWKDMQDKLGTHPLFQRLASFRNARVFSKGKEVAEDLRERWETSDSPLVHRIQDMTENFSVESEMAKTVREIRARDPAFDMIKFLRALKQDVKPVIQAYLRADEKVLQQHCSPEAVERLTSIVKAEQAQDRYADINMLDISDVELHDLQLFEDDPVVVVRFNAQQINCFRDKFDNVVEGSPDDVHRVVYVWALRQGTAGFVGKDGRLYPPQWQISEMAVGVAQKLL